MTKKANHRCNGNTRRRKEERKVSEEIYEVVITEASPKLTSDTKSQIQEARGVKKKTKKKKKKKDTNNDN